MYTSFCNSGNTRLREFSNKTAEDKAFSASSWRILAGMKQTVHATAVYRIWARRSRRLAP
jgi:hypothetical protein